jgi:hypothetical protein
LPIPAANADVAKAVLQVPHVLNAGRVKDKSFALSQVPEMRALVIDALSQVPEMRALLVDALSQVPEMRALVIDATITNAVVSLLEDAIF